MSVMEESLKTFADRLRFARKEVRKISQKRFADLLGVTQQAISQWESGETAEPRMVHKAADTLNISYKWLAYNAGPMELTEDDLIKEIRDLEETEKRLVEALVQSIKQNRRDK